MKYINRVSKGKIQKPSIDLIYGGAGVGKSSWAAGSKTPIFIDIEEGTKQLGVTRLDPTPKNFMEVMMALNELLSEPHEYKTVVIDSLDHLEMLIWDYTMASNNIKSRSDFNSYGRGADLSMESWQRLAQQLKALKEKMDVILICHSQIKEVKDPLRNDSYDRHDLKIHKKAAAFIVEVCDSVLFAHKEPSKKIDGTLQVGNEKRILYTSSTIAHEAKNRDNLPYQLPLEYEDFAKARLSHAPESAEELSEKIISRLELVKDLDTRMKAKDLFEKNKTDAEQLSKILNRLEVLTSK